MCECMDVWGGGNLISTITTPNLSMKMIKMIFKVLRQGAETQANSTTFISNPPSSPLPALPSPLLT